MSGVEIKGTTKIVGIFGDPVTYSLSPKMHNHAFERLNLDFVYVPFLVHPEQLKNAVDALRSLNLAGVNVTIPHKEKIIPYLDELSPLAEKIGAVNTIVNKYGKLIGHNTDAPGFIQSLTEDGKFNPKNRRVVMIGSGGVAKAIALTLVEAEVKRLVVLNRTSDTAQTLVEHLQKISKTDKNRISALELSDAVLTQQIRDCDLLINATPAGMDSVPLLPEIFVFDAVYAKVTPLLLSAKQIGAPHLGGLQMLIRQGALSSSLWTGIEPPIDLMKEALQ